MGDLGEQGTVHSPRVGNDGTGHGTEDVPEGSELIGAGVSDGHGSHHKGGSPGGS